ncbi:TlpA disulfide reductase family protein [Kibdelosporangium phytohabitans]|uniref:Alkyl hydroperoxide reductase n=1 Tax=Kibdelosporangium phytohabitans TaxID=860235 RepID=A0A0N9IFF2_9PSEU|nr:TlpA disulfide reductase family protein [Kibdelosporangium phytohabitans]ALG14004.1 alkyl hydroperoxide reductase [Kibdelosporangium phytohabitans]MBE1467041.1 thiol-disulfide isomerase/thioredoxin [Kibdelosporangium phytohabitans]
MRRLAIAAALLVLAGCSTGTDAVVRGTEFDFVAPGGKLEIVYDGADRKPLPDITGESLLEQGKQIKLSDYAGKVVLVNIWGAWCGPCRSEAPELEELYKAYKDKGVQVLGIDVRDDARSQPEDFMRDRGLTYPSIYDPGSRSLLGLKGYPRSAVPSTIILDKQHRVAQVFLIAKLKSDFEPVVERLLAEK